VREALDVLVRHGLLLLQDARLPSVATLVAGEVVRGSWWGHAAGKHIFRVAGELADHPDVATAKLLGGKVTFVHRMLFAELVSIGSARERWQTSGLSKDASALLARVDAEGTAHASGPAAKQLEAALLVASEQVHTASGAHALELQSWSVFGERRGVAARLAPAQARERVEWAVAAMAPGRAPKLPWSSPTP
jgi:hypothetical protein